MKKAISISLLLFALNILQAQVSELNWQKNTIVCDGSNSDWMERPGFFDAESGVLYEAYNDSTKLYILFELTQPGTQAKAMASGFNIEIVVKGKPRINAAIYMPVLKGETSTEDKTPNKKENNEVREPQQRKKGQHTQMRSAYQLLNSYAEVEGFIHNPRAIYPSNAKDSFVYNYGWDEKDAMLFEFCIPLHHLFGDRYKLEQIAKSEICIKPQFKGMERPADGNMHAQASMSPGGGGRQGGGRQGGGRSGGGHGGQPGGGMGKNQGAMDEMQELFTSHSFKYKIKLSATPAGN